MSGEKEVLNAIAEVRAFAETNFKEIDKKFGTVVNSESLAQVAQDIEARLKKTFPASALEGIHDRKDPAIARKEKMASELRHIFSGGREHPELAEEFKARTMRMKTLGVMGGMAAGGAFVGEELSLDIVEKARNSNFMMRLGTVLSNAPLQGTMPKEGNGVTFYWNKENASVSSSNPTAGQIAWGLSDVNGLVPISNALINFSDFDIAGWVVRLFGKELSDELLKKFWIGTGSGEPSGVRSATGYATTTQSGAHFDWVDLVNLEFLLDSKYRYNAIMVASKAVVKLIKSMNNALGAPLFVTTTEGKAKGLTGNAGGEADNLLAGWANGYPVYEHPNAVDTEIWMLNPKNYLVWEGGAVQIATSDQFYFDKNQTASRLTGWYDGQLVVIESASAGTVTSLVA